MITISIILLFLSVILVIISYNNFKKVKTINSDIDEKNLFLGVFKKVLRKVKR